MTKITALEELYYEKTRNPGESFEADDQHAYLLKTIGKARDYDPAVDDKKSIKRRDPEVLPPTEEPAPVMTREAVAEDETKENTPGRSQRYLRRDLRAKE